MIKYSKKMIIIPKRLIVSTKQYHILFDEEKNEISHKSFQLNSFKKMDKDIGRTNQSCRGENQNKIYRAGDNEYGINCDICDKL